MYNKGYTSATWHELEWKYEGLDFNYFAARYFDPILGRWHAPDPLEQCHSPYAGMVNDPANFVDPDGRLATPLITLASSGSFYLSTANSLVSSGMSIMGGVMSFASSISAGVAGFSAIKNTGDFINISLGFALRDGSFGEISQSIYSNTTSLVTGTSPIENDDAIMDDKFDKSENEEFALVMHRSEEILELSTGMQIVYSLSFSMVVGGEEIGLETRMLMYGDKAANLKGDNSLKKPEYDLSFEQMNSHAGEKNWENTIYIGHDAFIHPGTNTIHFEGCYGITKSDLILNDVLSNEKEQEYQMNFKSSVDALSEVREMYNLVLKEAQKAGQNEIKFTLRTNSTAVRNRKTIQSKNTKLKL
jgi:RHS repeat-associated protein